MVYDKKKVYEVIHSKFIMTIDRCFHDETVSNVGFPICMSDEFILTSVILYGKNHKC